MNCHERARAGLERPAVAICRHCSVGLYKAHLVETLRSSAKPLCTCLYQPEQRFDTLRSGSIASRSSARHRAA